MFVLSFENKNYRTHFLKYYVSKVQIKDFNELINGKSFFDMPIKIKEKKYKEIMNMGIRKPWCKTKKKSLEDLKTMKEQQRFS